jgi:putative oxidoreductase
MKRLAFLLGRVGLGAVFIVAAAPKIADPPGFAHMVSNYLLVPAPVVNFLALFFPWIEMLAGIALVTGLFGRTGAKLSAALLVVFILAIGINLARDHAVQCGCFDVHAAEKSHARLIGEMRWVVARDLGLLAVAAGLSLSKEAKRTGGFLRESPPEEE